MQRNICILCSYVQASLSDLDTKQIFDFLARNRVQHQEDFHPDISLEEQLQQFNFLQQSCPTFGALLCFSPKPTKWVTSAYVRCQVWQRKPTYGMLDTYCYHPLQKNLLTEDLFRG